MTYQDFSETLDKRPDLDQEKVIRSLKNTIVSAGAGSGKTQTLANRFAYLITADLQDSEGRPIKSPSVDRILTLTFTKKAAAEMYQRIYKTLKKFEAKTTDAVAKKRAKDALDNFSKARIQTLDSYSSGILRQAAARYGIRPDFSAGADSSKIADLAFEFVMENRNNPALQWISAPAKIKECAEFFASAAAGHTSLADSMNKEKRVNVFSESLEKQKKYIEESLSSESNPFDSIEKALARLEEIMPEEKPKGRQDWFDKTRAALAVWNSDRTMAARQKALDKNGVKNFAQSDEAALYAAALENFHFTNKIDFSDEIRNLIKNVLFGEDKKTPALASVAQNILAFYSDINFLEPLHALLDGFSTLANEAKRKSGELTFKDINDLALRALKEDEELRKQERGAYDFIMIDEFQDNNASNRDLLLAISTDDLGRVMQNRLFFVGDEKQSIYKFRGADVSVFNGLAEYIEPCDTLPMQNNYRSNNILLDGFNQIFGGFLPNDADKPSVQESDAKIFEAAAKEDYEAKFDQNARARFPQTKKALPPESEKRIRVCLFPSSNPDKDAERDDAESKAYFVAKEISSLHEEEKVPYKDIALLLKGRTHYAEISRAFARYDIPFSLDEQKNIFRQATANDFYNALRLCVYPADTNAFAAFLTSPFAGMTVDGAQRILSLCPKSAFDQNAQAQEVLDEEALKKYQAAQAFYKGFAPFALSNPIAAAVRRLWDDEGCKYSESANEEHYDLLFELARKADADGKDLSWFVDQLAKEKGKLAFGQGGGDELDIKDTDYPVEKSDAVSVMTIHKSKGLEFDHVFVWGLAEKSAGKSGDNSKVFHSDRFGAVVSNGSKKKNLFALLAQNEEDAKDAAEFRRLIYVAMTRAAQSLCVIGNEPPEKSESDKNKTLLKAIKAYSAGLACGADAPFKLELVERLKRGDEKFPELAQKRSLAKTRAAFNGAQTIQAVPAKNYWTSPSELEEKGGPHLGLASDSGYPRLGLSENAGGDDSAPASLAYPEINSFVNSSALQKNDYGTLFHKFMEDWSRDWENWTAQKVKAAEWFEGSPLVQKISEKNRETLLETFFKILGSFLQNAQNAALDALKCGRDFFPEFAFKTKIASYIISGSMDAVFQNADGTWTVLDYKTDARPDPALYYNQLACYKKSAADLFAGGDSQKVRCLLFFAETGTFADISLESQKALESLDDEKIFNLIEKT